MSSNLLMMRYRTALAHNGRQAIEMIVQLHPQMVVCDLELPPEDVDGIFAAATASRFSIPIIVTATDTASEDGPASRALKNGAFDCLTKPYSTDLLVRKIEQSLQIDVRSFEHGLLHDFSTFFNRISRLDSASDLETLLDISFDYFLQISQADGATLRLFEREKNSWLKVREKTAGDVPFDETVLAGLLGKVTATGQTGTELFKPAGGSAFRSGSQPSAPFALLAVPLKSGNDIKGIIVLERTGPATPFTTADRQAVEIVAIQVGNALVNSQLYETVNRKLLDLQIISSYSEKLMGMVDKYDVIRALFETAARHFDVDFMGFLVEQRRTHEFLYWSRHAVDEKFLQEFCNETVAVYNRAAEASPRRKRTVFHNINLDGFPGDPKLLPTLSLRYVVPLCWDELRFGAVFFGAVVEPQQSSGKLALLSSIVGQTRIALTNTKLYSDMKENYIRTIKALAIAVDAKDTYTHGHSENVMNIADEIARELSIDEKMIGSIRDAGLLHDIGKIGIPGYILNKPGPLTYEEFNGIMKTHSTLGANIVREVPFLRDLYKMILYHHEHYDGNGYPDGLRGEQIPLGARILHVADAFEAMTSNRPYRNSLGRTEAIRRLREESGKQFDPSIIAAFMRVAEKKHWLTDETPTDVTKTPAG
ncbi:MAG: HD domain-containing protein [Chitinispirillaceae bacterium]|nr:HD domain-containing protein [Chitinispirillaceae bacterium]